MRKCNAPSFTVCSGDKKALKMTRRLDDLDSKPFDTLIVFLKEFFEKVNFENGQQTSREEKHGKLPSMQRVKCNFYANSLYLDQDRQNVSPDLDPNNLTLTVFFEKV